MSGRGNVTSLLAKAGSGVGFTFGVRAWTEMKIRYVKGMHRLKLISSEKKKSKANPRTVKFVPIASGRVRSEHPVKLLSVGYWY